ncbi:MAG TPA: MFS transporter [Pseudonocardiaceae bacterium]|nr:MFS transporter [Pseudonocardiaceae bacterium]
MPTALRIADFRFLLVGNLISNLGSWLLVVAIPYQVFRLTGSVAATGLTLAVESLPALIVGPVAGVFVDRWNRRLVMITADLLCAVSVAGILLADQPNRLGWLYLALVTENLGIVFFRPAARALLPTIVGDDLVSANSLLAVNNGIVRLIGPPLGALLLAWLGLPTVITADVASYLVSALAITATGRRASTATASTVRTILGELVEGLRFTRRDPTLGRLLIISTVFFTCNAVFTALLIPFMTTRFGHHPATIGYLLSALGIGYLLGGPLAGRLLRRHTTTTLLTLGLAGVGLAFTLLANAPTAPIAVLAGGLAGLPGSVLIVTIETTIQRTTPDPLRGRVGATFYASDALAALIGALIGTTAGQPALTVSAVTILVTAAATLIRRR